MCAFFYNHISNVYVLADVKFYTYKYFKMFTVSHILPCQGRNYVHFYTAIFQMCIVSHIFPSRGKQYVHFYINMSNVYFFAYIPVSG